MSKEGEERREGSRVTEGGVDGDNLPDTVIELFLPVRVLPTNTSKLESFLTRIFSTEGSGTEDRLLAVSVWEC